MQKPVKRGNAWRIQVKYKHLRDAATRDSSEECIQWAHRRLMELQLEYEKGWCSKKYAGIKRIHC